MRTGVFVSYHHGPDKLYYQQLQTLLRQNMIIDHSLQAPLKSQDEELVISQIRDGYIKQASCVIVLCGLETHRRMFVDWEIKAALDYKCGLVGVELPGIAAEPATYIPPRLKDNLSSGFALRVQWQELLAHPSFLSVLFQEALAKPKMLIRNCRPPLTCNGEDFTPADELVSRLPLNPARMAMVVASPADSQLRC